MARETVGQVYGVHTVRADEVSATACIWSTLKRAEGHAQALSGDPGVLGAAVTRFLVDQPGVRTAVSLWVAGQRQEAPYISNDRRVWANGLMPWVDGR